MKNTPQQEEGEEWKHKVGGWEEEQLHLHTYTMDIMDMNSISGFYLLRAESGAQPWTATNRNQIKMQRKKKEWNSITEWLL